MPGRGPRALADARTKARAFGHKLYQGRPCPHGHGVVRYVSNASCAACVRQRNDVANAGRKAEYRARCRRPAPPPSSLPENLAAMLAKAREAAAKARLAGEAEQDRRERERAAVPLARIRPGRCCHVVKPAARLGPVWACGQPTRPGRDYCDRHAAPASLAECPTGRNGHAC